MAPGNVCVCVCAISDRAVYKWGIKGAAFRCPPPRGACQSHFQSWQSVSVITKLHFEPKPKKRVYLACLIIEGSALEIRF